MEAFSAGAGFSASWFHSWMLVITGVVVALVGAALVGCLMHKLEDGVWNQGAAFMIKLLALSMVTTIFFGVLKSL